MCRPASHICRATVPAALGKHFCAEILPNTVSGGEHFGECCAGISSHHPPQAMGDTCLTYEAFRFYHGSDPAPLMRQRRARNRSVPVLPRLAVWLDLALSRPAVAWRAKRNIGRTEFGPSLAIGPTLPSLANHGPNLAEIGQFWPTNRASGGERAARERHAGGCGTVCEQRAAPAQRRIESSYCKWLTLVTQGDASTRKRQVSKPCTHKSTTQTQSEQSKQTMNIERTNSEHTGNTK